MFLAYVQQQLAPTLNAGNLVILDNRSSHKKAGVREAIASAEAGLLCLPPYSPDLNPIENAFSKFKWLLKNMAERTVNTLWSACGNPLDQLTETECRNDLRHGGRRHTEPTMRSGVVRQN